MVEAVSTAAPKQFTTVQYNTKDGETITATKKDGVVTLVGDKSGVRKMPIEDFRIGCKCSTLRKNTSKRYSRNF